MAEEPELKSIQGSAGGRRWSFGPAVFDERSLELRVRGTTVDLERKPIEVLIHLLQNAGEVVTKDELADTLWPGRILTESVLTRTISVLRQALGDQDKSLIRTVHGHGYRLDANVTVETSQAARTAPRFGFKAGDAVPMRPQWRLVERLGTGGRGEAWLARHEKTHDPRVFKFALDERALASLKREVTLYRLLHDSLGMRAAVTSILEWNFEERPYFIELEYIEGRDLRSWADSRGGVAQIPLPERLELVAQVADALATAHSVGVLHKDLKPGNILVQGSPAAVKLADFGSGALLDPGRLDALGITRAGLTTGQIDAGGTALYLAPEILAGQPFTVQADIYALGVVLYQMVLGDLRRTFTPGWERTVEDELLREDIALTAEGNPAKRLADAGALAGRLRTLETRRAERTAELETRVRIERAEQVAAALRRTRVFAAALLAFAVTAVTGYVWAYRAEADAVAARNTAKAVGDFLMEDVLTVDRSVERPKEASYESLLDRAASRVEERFEGHPEAAATVSWLLGRRYQEIGNEAAAIDQYRKVLKFSTGRKPSRIDLLALERLMALVTNQGDAEQAEQLAHQVRKAWTAHHAPRDLSTLMLRTRLAHALVFLGKLEEAETELRAVLLELPLAEAPTDHTNLFFKEWFGVSPGTGASARSLLLAYVNETLGANVLGEFGHQYEEAEARTRQALQLFAQNLGENHETTILAASSFGAILIQRGKFAEAEQLLGKAKTFLEAHLPAKHLYVAVQALCFARLRLEQQRTAEAARFAAEALGACVAAGCKGRVKAEFIWDMGRAAAAGGQLVVQSLTSENR